MRKGLVQQCPCVGYNIIQNGVNVCCYNNHLKIKNFRQSIYLPEIFNINIINFYLHIK